MSEDNKDAPNASEEVYGNPETAQNDAEAQARADAMAADTNESAEIDMPGDMADEFIELHEENKDLKNRLLLLAADMENLRRRTEREKQDLAKYAISNFARDVLTVGDNLSRTLLAVPAEARDNADETLKGILDGVEMTEREMVNVLGRHGVETNEPKGEKFNPNFHQAIFEIENPDVPSGTVLEVMQSGYAIGDRVLRPAMVGVSKGGPKTQKPTAVPEPEVSAGPEASAEAPGSTDPADLGKNFDTSA